MLKFRSSFIKIPVHKEFSYKPRYYNPDREKYSTGTERKRTLSGPGISEKWRQKMHSQRSSRLRIYMLIILLSLVVYLILR